MSDVDTDAESSISALEDASTFIPPKRKRKGDLCAVCALTTLTYQGVDGLRYCGACAKSTGHKIMKNPCRACNQKTAGYGPSGKRIYCAPCADERGCKTQQNLCRGCLMKRAAYGPDGKKLFCAACAEAEGCKNLARPCHGCGEKEASFGPKSIYCAACAKENGCYRKTIRVKAQVDPPPVKPDPAPVTVHQPVVHRPVPQKASVVAAREPVADDVEDEEEEEEESSEDIYCICRRPREGRFMIACDRCQDWFHGDCVGVAPESVDSNAEFYCPRCKPLNKKKSATM